jgi:hypothetical protein
METCPDTMGWRRAQTRSDSDLPRHDAQSRARAVGLTLGSDVPSLGCPVTSKITAEGSIQADERANVRFQIKANVAEVMANYTKT